MTRLRVLDLFSGTGGWSQAFVDHGHTVTRIDNDERFAPVPYTTMFDVLNFSPVGLHEFDVVLASPPCQAFSLGAGGTHIGAFGQCYFGHRLRKVHEQWVHETVGEWEHGTVSGCTSRQDGNIWLEPVSEFGKLSIALVDRTLELIDIIQPKFWWMENPNGGMVHFVPADIPRVQVTYCQYGESRMKLTNLWGRWPDTWHPRPRCKNGDPCHEAARRGAKTGTQGLKNAVDRAIVPYELSLDVCRAVEETL